MYENKLWTDVSFRCKGSKEENTSDRIRAHRNILAASSPVFEAMLFGDFAKDDIALEDVEVNIFDLVLRFVYSKKTSLGNANVVSVLEIAHRYQLTSLVAYCAEYIYPKLLSDIVCSMLGMALQYGLSKFQAKVLAFIDDHATEVLKSDGFLSVSQECLTRILKRDTFNADEKNIVERTMQWADRKCTEEKLEATGENKRKVLGDAFFQLRMTTLKMQDFLQLTRRNNYYTREESEDICSRIAGDCEVTLSFHNLLPRVHRRAERKVPDKKINDSVCYLNEIQCSVKAQVSRQTCIKGLTLKNVLPYIRNEESQRVYYTGNGRQVIDVALSMRGQLTIEGHDSVIFAKKDWISSGVWFKESLCLVPREKPYDILLQLAFDYKQIAFKALASRSVKYG